MQELLISILASVSVSVLLKWARQKNLLIEQMVAINYAIAIALTAYFLQPNLSTVDWGAHSWLFIALGILLPSVFVMMGRAVEFAGIVKSDAAQRLSLFLPILAAFTIFGEALATNRVVGLILAFIALFCLLNKPNHQNSTPHQNQTSSVPTGVWLLGVWLGYGVIDILFKQLSKQGAAFSGSLLITFALAGILMLAYLVVVKRTKWQKNALLAGVALGALNFTNILFYIKAHQVFKENPTIVFAGMNMGVIALGTIVGALLFKEKISKINMIGIALAMCAIICLYFWNHLF